MFKKKITEQELLELLEKRALEIKRFDKLPQLDSFYLSILAKCKNMEITPDIRIFGYEEALKENRYLSSNYPNIAQRLWIIGDTGQGDSWFLDKEKGCILFYDHNQGEYSNIKQFICLNISFFEFLQMAFLYKELEYCIKENTIDKNKMTAFKEAIDSIEHNLYELYPFRYFG